MCTGEHGQAIVDIIIYSRPAYMSMTFTKLFSSITESTIWSEDHPTRLTWITMLAMADRRGRVWASIPGLANRARVTLEEVEAALQKLLSSDKYSRTSEFEGRRIEPIDGGWRLLNHEKYRSIRDEETVKETKRNYINKRRANERTLSDIDEENVDISENVDRCRPIAEASTEAEAVLQLHTPNKTETVSGKTPDFNNPKKKIQKIHLDTARSLLIFLNEKTGRNYQPVKANIDMIAARMKEGATERQCRLVILRKFHDWGADEKMQEHMAECYACGASTHPKMKVCAACKAPIQRGTQIYRDPRHGFCEYNDHGLLCDQPGSISLHIGEGGPWYCSNHALGLKGMKPKKIGQIQNIAAHLKPFLTKDDEATLERKAIQSE